jgi:hypothetical protein
MPVDLDAETTQDPQPNGSTSPDPHLQPNPRVIRGSHQPCCLWFQVNNSLVHPFPFSLTRKQVQATHMILTYPAGWKSSIPPLTRKQVQAPRNSSPPDRSQREQVIYPLP